MHARIHAKTQNFHISSFVMCTVGRAVSFFSLDVKEHILMFVVVRTITIIKNILYSHLVTVLLYQVIVAHQK